MPASKHRKKGQKKAVKRPGRARLVAEAPSARQERLLGETALAAVGADELSDDDFDLLTFVLDLVLEEVLALNVDGTRFVPCIGSREAVIEAFCEEFMKVFGKVPGFETTEARQAAAAAWLERLGAVGFLRLEEDQLILAVPVPAVG